MAVVAGRAPHGAAVHSELLLRARATAGGTVLDVLAGHGQLVARQTGQDQVHLVGQTAGPLNGDELEIRIEVGPGARLSVASAAATLALPGAGRDPSQTSSIRVRAVVGQGAELVWAPEPLVVASGAAVVVDAHLRLAATARAHYREFVVLGRHGEAGGHVRARLQVERDGEMVLSQTLDSTILDRTGRWTGRAERVLATDLQVRPEPWPAAAAVAGGAVAVQVSAGVLLVSAAAETHPAAAAALAAAQGSIAGRAPSAHGPRVAD